MKICGYSRRSLVVASAFASSIGADALPLLSSHIRYVQFLYQLPHRSRIFLPESYTTVFRITVVTTCRSPFYHLAPPDSPRCSDPATHLLTSGKVSLNDDQSFFDHFASVLGNLRFLWQPSELIRCGGHAPQQNTALLSGKMVKNNPRPPVTNLFSPLTYGALTDKYSWRITFVAACGE